MSEIKFDPNAPAFGEGAEKVVAPAGEAIVPEPKPEVEVKEEVVEDSAEKPRVPYSRFENVNKARREAEAEVERWRNRTIELESTLLERKPAELVSSDLPDWWAELYGDSDASKRGWKIQQEQNEKTKAELRAEALNAVREEQAEEAARTNENLETLDDHLDSVSAVAGRDLTEKEQSAILDIIDEYTPKDGEGNYAGALISPDKAWEIYELKQEAQLAPKKQERNSVAALTSPHSAGQPDGDKAEKDKNWNPLDWSFLQKVK